jgi:hypothetical protein
MSFFSPLSRLSAGLLACQYDKRRRPYPYPRPPHRASSPRATSLAARCYEVRCRFSLSRPIISLLRAPHMHAVWKQVFGREMASRTYRYFDFDFGLGSSRGADHRCTNTTNRQCGSQAACMCQSQHTRVLSIPWSEFTAVPRTRCAGLWKHLRHLTRGISCSTNSNENAFMVK